MLLHALLGWLAVHWHWLSRLAKGTELRLLRDGTVDEKALRRALMTENNLLEALRLKGVADPHAAKSAYLERSGEVSAIR